MKKNLNQKIILIVAVLLVCLFGIFGIRQGISGKAYAGRHVEADSSGPRSAGRRAPDSAGAGAGSGERRDRQRSAAIRQDLKKANLSFSAGGQARSSHQGPVHPQGNGQAGDDPHRWDLAGAIRRHQLTARGNKYANEYDVSGGNTSPFILTMKPIFESDLEKKNGG